jgi:hypothetical protein
MNNCLTKVFRAANCTLRRAYATPPLSQMANIIDQYHVASEAEKNIILAAVVYPKTSTSLKDNPRISFEHGITHKGLPEFLESNLTLRAYSATNDVQQTVELLKKYEAELLASKVDMIQIYKGGIDVLRIYNNQELAEKLKPRQLAVTEAEKTAIEQQVLADIGVTLDRSIYVEVNWVRARLFEESKNRRKRYIILAGSILFVAIYLVNLYYVIFFKVPSKTA